METTMNKGISLEGQALTAMPLINPDNTRTTTVEAEWREDYLNYDTEHGGWFGNTQSFAQRYRS